MTSTRAFRYRRERGFVIPPGYTQRILATQLNDFTPVAGSGGALPDMNTLNETGPDAGQLLYRTHEVGSNGAVTVTDLRTGVTSLATQASHYERLDGITWTPWRTVIFAEEAVNAARRDPAFPNALRGLVYEYDPPTGVAVARPAVGARSHEGLRFDAQGNLYGRSTPIRQRSMRARAVGRVPKTSRSAPVRAPITRAGSR